MRRLLRSHAVEKGILLAFELGDRTGQRVALATEGVGVTAALAGLGVRERCLGYEGPQPGGVGLLLHVEELLLRDREVGAQAAKPVADVDEAPLEQGVGHDRILRAGARQAHGGYVRRRGMQGVKNVATRVENAVTRKKPEP